MLMNLFPVNIYQGYGTQGTGTQNCGKLMGEGGLGWSSFEIAKRRIPEHSPLLYVLGGGGGCFGCHSSFLVCFVYILPFVF